MKYILLNMGVVGEIIPDEDPYFPGIPIEERYAPDFIDQLLPVADEVEVEQNWVYDPDSKKFSLPVKADKDPEGYTVGDEEVESAYREGVDSYE